MAAESVVLAAGGFEADPGLRAAHLGEGWEHAKVRGTPHNTGEVLAAALRRRRGQGWRLDHLPTASSGTPGTRPTRATAS